METFQALFECKTTFENQIYDYKKRVKELYCVKAVSFADAEAKAVAYAEKYANGCLYVTDIKRAKYGEPIQSDVLSDDKFFKVKVVFIIMDVEGIKKRDPQLFLVQAESTKGAEDSIRRFLDDVNYTIESIVETKIICYIDESN